MSEGKEKSDKPARLPEDWTGTLNGQPSRWEGPIGVLIGVVLAAALFVLAVMLVAREVCS